MLSQKREMFMVRFLSAQSLVTLRIWGPLKEERQFVTIFCHKWRYCPVNKIFWAWFVAMLRKGDIWGLVWSNALDRRYLRSDFLHRFRPIQRWDTKDWWWLYTSTLIAAEQRGGWLFIFKPGFRFVLVMFFWTSKTSSFYQLWNSWFLVGFELVSITLTYQREKKSRLQKDCTLLTW